MNAFLDLGLVGGCVWIQTYNANRSQLHTSHWAPIGHAPAYEGFWRGDPPVWVWGYQDWVDNGKPGSYGLENINDDPAFITTGEDAKRAALASMFTRSETAVPGEGKPLNPQHA
jgi:hypothetical protein